MAITTGKSSVTQTDYLFYDSGVTGTAVDDVFGGAVKIHSIQVQNIHAADDAYLKLYDVAPTVGTTAPFMILKSPADSTVVWTSITGLDMTRVSYVAVDEGGTTGTSAPTTALKLYMVVR